MPGRFGPCPPASYQAWLARQDAHVKAWLEGSGFEAKPGACALLPGQDGAPAGALVVLSEPTEPWDVAAAHARLPEGDWRLAPAEADLDREPGGARLGARQLPVRSLPQARREAAPPRGRRGRRRPRRDRRRGGLAGARSDQHAGCRSRPGRARGRGRRPSRRGSARPAGPPSAMTCCKRTIRRSSRSARRARARRGWSTSPGAMRTRRA